MSKSLVIYYSRKGENYFNGSIRSIQKGNTEIVAEFIAQAVQGDLFEVDTVKPYAADYNTCIEEAKQELRANARPTLKKYLSDISAYDTIFVCGPCWWGTYPMAIFSQLEKLNFSGKKIIPLMTHEGSGLANAEHDLKKLCPGATLGRGLAIQGGSASRSQQEVTAWAQEQLKTA